MRIWLLIAALAALISLATGGTAGAATTCSYPASAYSTGGSPGTGAVNDPLFPKQWGLRTIKAPGAWQHGYKGAGATIAIVDTGIDLVHPDLQAHLVPGADLDPGYAGDATTPAEPKGGVCPGPQDENGHGTHVAGIAAAVTNNGIGVAGTAPDASLMPVRVLDASGSGDDQTVIDGIKYAADHGAKVINLSLGGAAIVGELPNSAMSDAVNYAYTKGAVVVAAAGNESIPLCSYPAAAKNAVCVGAVDSRGAPTFYSNFPNSPDGNVGVRAPGGLGTPFCEEDEDIWSTIWPGSADDCQTGGSLTGYDTLAGTSMATPFVSGVAALLAAKGLSAPQILECLKSTSSNNGSYDPVMGYGIVDADAATAHCGPQTAAFQAPAGGSGGSSGGSRPASQRDYLIVRVKRTSMKQLARTRKLRVTVTSSRAIKVNLKAVARRGRAKARRISSGAVTLTKAGTKTTTLRISRRQARTLKRRGTSVQVLYRAGARAGIASTR